jgi:nickel/cobalt exporter
MLVSGLLVIIIGLRLLWPVAMAARRHAHAHGHTHDHDDDHHHGHGHSSPDEIRRSYAGRHVTRGEIVWFGFSGGLLPCPAAIAVLLVCLQLKAFTLGVAMVAAFSLGLAITLVAVGVAAAWGARKATASLPRADWFLARLPILSGLVVVALGLVFTVRGLIATGLV